MMFKDSRVQKGPGEGKSLVSREWQIATRERKGKKRKGNTWQSTRPLSTSRPLFHHQVSLMLWVALSQWYPDVCGRICQTHCLDDCIVLWNHLLLRWQLQILQSDFLELQISYTTEKQSFLQQKAIQHLSVRWECSELGSLYLNFENTSVFFLGKCTN